MGLKRGDLIKWISHHNTFEASPMGVKGIDPIYRLGIVLEVSHTKTTAIIAHCFDCKHSRLVILDTEYDFVEIISEKTDG
jgi:hypothetical protein|tara:strand:+ start:713 stop:952 length:240 start_codon:yes stop_codon:yes gene_type:complete